MGDSIYQGQIPFDAGKLSDPFAINRDFALDGLMLKLNLTGDTAGSVSADPEGPMSIIKTVRIEADGDIIQEIDFETLSMLPYFFDGVIPIKSLITAINETDVELGYCAVPLMFNAQGLYPGFASYLLAPIYNALNLRILWGDASDLGTGYTVDSGYLEVSTLPNYMVTNPPVYLKRMRTIQKNLTD